MNIMVTVKHDSYLYRGARAPQELKQNPKRPELEAVTAPA